MRVLPITVLLLAGCDSVFGLDHVKAGSAGSGSADQIACDDPNLQPRDEFTNANPCQVWGTPSHDSNNGPGMESSGSGDLEVTVTGKGYLGCQGNTTLSPSGFFINVTDVFATGDGYTVFHVYDTEGLTISIVDTGGTIQLQNEDPTTYGIKLDDTGHPYVWWWIYPTDDGMAGAVAKTFGTWTMLGVVPEQLGTGIRIDFGAGSKGSMGVAKFQKLDVCPT